MGLLKTKVNSSCAQRKSDDLFEPADLSADAQNLFDQIRSEAATTVADPVALAEMFSRHSVNEGIGASTIEHVGKLASGSLQSCLLEHAGDERRHASIFAALAARLPSGFKVDLELLRVETDDNQAFITNYDGNLARFLCDTHVAENRNLIILEEYIDHLSLSNAVWAKDFEKAVLSIYEDELRHVYYTGKLIDKWKIAGIPVISYLEQACDLYEAALCSGHGAALA